MNDLTALTYAMTDANLSLAEMLEFQESLKVAITEQRAALAYLSFEGEDSADLVEQFKIIQSVLKSDGMTVEIRPTTRSSAKIAWAIASRNKRATELSVNDAGFWSVTGGGTQYDLRAALASHNVTDPEDWAIY